jgi:hypothetical protein
MTAKLSACVMAADDLPGLERCLNSLAFVDEIVVLADSRHGNAAAELARKYADRVEAHAYEGDLDQRARSIALASNDWVLAIDPDEVVSAELARSIERALAQSTEGKVAGYELDRLTFHLGRWIRHGDFYPDWKLRLFRRSTAKVVGENPHGRVAVDGAVGRLEGVLEHYSYRDLSDQIDRIRFFSGESARAMHARGVRVGFSDLVLRPPARFLRAYVLKLGLLDGWPGFIIAAATAFHVFLKYALLFERSRTIDPESGTTGEMRREDDAR